MTNRTVDAGTLGRRRVLQAAGCGVALAVFGPSSRAQPSSGGPLLVYAASSLADALTALAAQWKAGPDRLRFSFAASSTLARQIEQGAPAHLFISADEAWMDYLVERRRVDAASRRVVAANRLVVVQPGAANASADESVQALRAALRLNEPGARIATGDPAHVPAGRYAQAALTQLGLWADANPRLVRADSVRSALSFVERGEALSGIVYATDARLSGKVHVAAQFPAASHPPIRYPAALVSGAPAAARELLERLLLHDAQAVLRAAGFLAPG